MGSGFIVRQPKIAAIAGDSPAGLGEGLPAGSPVGALTPAAAILPPDHHGYVARTLLSQPDDHGIARIRLPAGQGVEAGWSA
jgi:hypothetical protein